MTSNVDDTSAPPGTEQRDASGVRPSLDSKTSSPKPHPSSALAKQQSPAAASRLYVVKKEDDGSNGPNGTSFPADGQPNESEAETEILSDAVPDETARKPKKAMKKEESDVEVDGANHGGNNGTAASRRKRADRRADGADDTAEDDDGGLGGKRNGMVNGSGSKSERARRKSISTAVSTSPHSSGAPSRQDAPRSPSETHPSPPPHSAKFPSHHRGRSVSAAEPRKRKARDDASLRNVEPPRQRQKVEGASTRESPSQRNQPASPATATAPASALSATGAKLHRRSASTQSAAQQAAVQSRRKRDGSHLVLQPQKREAYNSGSSSDGDSSPRPSHPAVQSHQQLKRSSHRSLTSPARAMPHDRKRTDRFGATKLAREAERGELQLVKAAFHECPDDLDQPDFAGIAPLQKAALNGHVDVVEFLIDSGCKTDCQSDNRDTPLIDAAENGHLDVIRVLLRKGKVNPHHQNKKGERAIDLIPSDDEDFEEMSRELKEAMLRETDTGPPKDGPPNSATKAEVSGLLYNEYNTETLKAKAAEGDMQLVGELLASNVKPNIQCGVAAARAGHHEILSLFLAEGLKPDPDPSKHPDTPMTVAIGRGHLKVIELLLGQDNFDPTRKTKDGKTYWELAEERRGPKWEQERDLLQSAYDETMSRRQKTSPKRERKQAHIASTALQAKPKVARKSSPRPSERSSSPSRVEGKRQIPRKSVPEQDPPKGRRLLTAKEMTTQREVAAKRRRRVVEEESSSSEIDVRRSKKSAAKPRAASEGEETKPVKKHSTKSHADGHDKPRKLRTSSPPHQSDESAGETHKRPKKASAKPRSAEPPKTRAVQPTPETSSGAETKRKPTKKSPHSASSSKVMSEISPESPHDASKSAHPSSPTDTSKSAAQLSPRQASEPSAPSPAPPAPPPPPSRTPTPVREERLAEARRKEEEERIAAEKARLEAERARQEAERIRLEAERLERMSKLPPALRRACEKGMDRPLCFDQVDMGITFSFFPIYLFPLAEVDPAAASAMAPDDPSRNKPYMLSFQAVGVLGLRELDIAETHPDWERKEVTDAQWDMFLQQYDIAKMAQATRFPMPGSRQWDEDKVQRILLDTKAKMKSMSPLYWIPFDAFDKEVKEGLPIADWKSSEDDKENQTNGLTINGDTSHAEDKMMIDPPEDTIEQKAAKEKNEREKRVREMLRTYPMETKKYIKSTLRLRAQQQCDS